MSVESGRYGRHPLWPLPGAREGTVPGAQWEGTVPGRATLGEGTVPGRVTLREGTEPVVASAHVSARVARSPSGKCQVQSFLAGGDV